jgi:hypothetical protein
VLWSLECGTLELNGRGVPWWISYDHLTQITRNQKPHAPLSPRASARRPLAIWLTCDSSRRRTEAMAGEARAVTARKGDGLAGAAPAR